MWLHKLFKNHMLAIASLVLLAGLAATAWAFLGEAIDPDLWARYVALYPEPDPTNPAPADWNLWLKIIAPIIVLMGGWYVGEQLLMRRKFRRLMATMKKSEFQDHLKPLEDLARRLPDAYKARIEAKEATFVSRR